MKCKKYCNTCDDIIFVPAPTESTGLAEIKLPEMVLYNNKRICLVITETIPEFKDIIPIVFLIGAEKYPYVNRNGNFVYSDQITSRRLYIFELKTDIKIAMNQKCNLKPTNKAIGVSED